MSVEYVKKMKGTDDPRIDEIYKRTERKVIRTLKFILRNAYRVPPDYSLPETPPRDIEDIIEEVTIKRYNRIGSEGMSQKSIEGLTTVFKESDIDVSDLQAWLEEEGIEFDEEKPRRGKIGAY